MRYLVLIISFLIVSTTHQAQNKTQIQKANDLLQQQKFTEALPLWKEIHKTNPSNYNANFKLGLCYFNIPEKKVEALEYFLKASESTISDYNFYAVSEVNAPFDAFYFLGESYLLEGNTDKALENFLEYSSRYEGAPPINVVDKISKSYNTLSLKLRPRNADVSPLDENLNSEQREQSPIMSWDETTIYFASDKNGNLDIYSSEWNTDNTFSKPTKLNFSSEKDEYPVCISSNNNTLYLSRKDEDGYNLYKVTKDDNFWGTPQALENFNSSANEIGMSISSDEKYVYISSDREAGNGGFDIYMAKKKFDGNYGALKNLTSLNSKFDEIAPFISSDNKSLFYSSNNEKNGVGGFDIFFSQVNENEQWMKPINLGFPINSALDDYYYNASASPNLAYYVTLVDNNFDLMKIEGLNVDSLANEGEFSKAKKEEEDQTIVKIIKEVESSDLEGAIKIVDGLDAEVASKVIDGIDVSKAVGIVDGLETTKAVSIMDEVPLEKAIDVANGLQSNKTSAIVEGVDIQKATGIMDGMEVSKAVEMFETINVEKATGIMEGMEPNKSSKIIEDIPIAKAIDVLDGMQVEKSVGIVENMEIEKAIGVVNEMDQGISKNIMGEMQPMKAAEVMDGINVEKAVAIVEEMPIEKAIHISENMQDEKSSQLLASMDSKKAVDIIEGIPIDKAIKVVGNMDDAVAINIIENIEIEKAVEVLGGMEEEKGKRIVDNLQSRLDEVGSEKIIALLKKYFAGQISEMESYIFKQVYFDFNSAELNLLSKQELLMLVEFLAENPFVKIEVVGHTDNTGDWDVNLRISGERANVVYRFLRDNKISHDRIIFYGKGSAQPIASNETDAGRKMNRRVEVILLQ